MATGFIERLDKLREAHSSGQISEHTYRERLGALLMRAEAIGGDGVERNHLDSEGAAALRGEKAAADAADNTRRRELMRKRMRINLEASRGSSAAPCNAADVAAPECSAAQPAAAAATAIKLSDLQLSKVIGEGAFGTVHLALRKGVGSFVAVKTINFSLTAQACDIQKVVNEIRIMKEISGHEHVVRYLSAEKTQDPKTGCRALHVIMEYVPGGSLSSVATNLSKRADLEEAKARVPEDEPSSPEYSDMSVTPPASRSPSVPAAVVVPMVRGLDESTVRCYVSQILHGLAFLHAKGIVHRDIKGENVLVNAEGCVKLADFGTASMIESCGRDVVGTPWFMAPEVVMSPEDKEGHGVAADVWSLGATTLQLLNGEPPLSKHLSTASACMYAIAKGSVDLMSELPAGVSPECRQFIQTCLTREPQLRPSAEALLKDPWMAAAPEILVPCG